jgi:ABC-type branched-subunit amino acid transport system ATPase component
VLYGISLHAGFGDFVCVIGANTAGKSTLLRAISRLVPRGSGRIEFDGHDLLPLSAHEVPRLGIAHVGTAILLVEQNAALALSLATRGFVLESGRIALEGSADILRDDPRIREADLVISMVVRLGRRS